MVSDLVPRSWSFLAKYLSDTGHARSLVRDITNNLITYRGDTTSTAKSNVCPLGVR